MTTTAAVLNQTRSTEGILGLGKKSIEDVAWLRVLRYLLYALTFLISLPGNLIICAIIMRRRTMRTITNILILNLAFSDVLYTVVVPMDIAANVSDIWPFGEFLCKILYPFMTLCIGVSAFTLTVIALSRFWAVVFPLRRQVTVAQIKITVAVIWLMSVLEVIPYAAALQVSRTGCCEELSWANGHSRKVYTIVLFLLQFVIPLIAISFAYGMVAFELKTRDYRTQNRCLERIRNRESKKIIKMLVLVTVAFALCNLPTSVMWIINEFAATKISRFDDIIFFLNILDFGNAAVNPCIYLTCNDDFKCEFRRFWEKIPQLLSQRRFPEEQELNSDMKSSRSTQRTRVLETTDTDKNT